jgi:hypothetical protein
MLETQYEAEIKNRVNSGTFRACLVEVDDALYDQAVAELKETEGVKHVSPNNVIKVDPMERAQY